MRSPVQAKSITHVHLLSVVASELDARGRDEPLRVLDVGCGDGALLEYFTQRLPEFTAQRTDLYGFDVHDHGVQSDGFMAATLARLTAARQDIPWGSRISSIAQTDAWPYDDGSFDVVLSNQVLEHIADHARLFAETRRVLRDGGYAVHLFPLKHYIWEDHLKLPLVHRIAYFDLLRTYIRGLSRLGLGKFHEHQRLYHTTLDEFSEQHADFMLHYTNYQSYRDFVRLAKDHGLRLSFRYTKEFYLLKLRSMMGRPAKRRYRRQSALGEWLAFMGLRYASSVTLFLEKRGTFRQK
jgi:SAM-dependent methyltransferase